MEKKISIKSAAVIAGAVAVITFSATSFWAFQICNDSVAMLRKKAKSIEDIYTVDQYIDEKYYGEYDEEKIVDSSLKAMVAALEDKYSAYMTPDEYEQNLLDAKGSISGIGIVVNLTEENEIKVVDVNEEGPAKEAGVKTDDVITAIDGKNVSEMEYADAVNLVRGETGTEVTLTVKRGTQQLDFTMTREEIVSQSVTSRMLENDIAYIRISGFKENTSYQYNVELKKCLEDGAKAIIFDLRNNGGGLVSACSDCLDPLLPEGDIAIAEFKDGSSEVICKSDSLELDLPMAVLVNENSASAAELFAAALRDFDKAVLVGKNTFGKGIMQNTYNLDNGGGLRLTVAKYRTVKSECYHGVGLAPDYEADIPEKYAQTSIEDIPENEDTQLQKAIEILKATPHN
ncbi:MAG: S41 family peptidase [Porcipelethomonas sp.]